MLKVKPRTTLSLVKPHFSGEVEKKQLIIKTKVDAKRGPAELFQIDERVFVRSV